MNADRIFAPKGPISVESFSLPVFNGDKKRVGERYETRAAIWAGVRYLLTRFDVTISIFSLDTPFLEGRIADRLECFARITERETSNTFLGVGIGFLEVDVSAQDHDLSREAPRVRHRERVIAPAPDGAASSHDQLSLRTQLSQITKPVSA